MLCALIMAGGRGTRFYPLSTEQKPKQFLNLVGDKTMIQMTVNRLKNTMSFDQIFIATGEIYKNIVKEQLPEIPDENIIIEPCGRNTAPCIVLGALTIKKKYPHTNIIVLPSDALVQDVDEFNKIVQTADKFLDNNLESVITLGIKPNRPEVGYGYIKQLSQKNTVNNREIFKVEKFVEKPNLETAVRYLEDGCYLWNAGIFVWNVDYVEMLAKKHLEDTYNKLSEVVNSNIDEYEARLKELYPLCESISIDYAIMEKIDSIHVIPSEFGWDDIGTWVALERYLPHDTNNNINNGNMYIESSNNNIVFSSGKKIVLLDVNDMFCLESDDMIVVGKKENLSNVHKLKDKNI